MQAHLVAASMECAATERLARPAVESMQ
uniref:Uncharacterized protein n=1 Tax=Arundo donax TaxID=35708 RepID=A0A0A8ZP06_ARUDO